MNTGESLFAIGALLLLSLTILRVNNNIILTDSMMYDSKFGIIANSVATSLIEKATQENFDQITVTGSISNQALLTLNLGPEGGETGPDIFNDFDDYDDWEQQDTFFNSLVFHSKCKIEYVDPAISLQSSVNYQTWHKKITVNVWWDENGKVIGHSQDTIRHSTIYSYWYFN